MAKKGQAFDEVKVAPQEVFIQKLADKFKSQMDAFFRKNLGDDPIMKEWHRSFYEAMAWQELNKDKYYPPVEQWLRPSMVGADEQQIWLQLHEYKSDQVLSNEPQDEIHTRWQAIGTQVGDMWQRQVLAAEHWTDKGKAQVDFRFERVLRNYTDFPKAYPYFEEFAREYHEIDGVPVWGTCDGILNYFGGMNGLSPDDVTRIGFEVKSKQTTNASTGTYKMKTYEEKHRQQILTYALMYDLDYYFILYQNCSKKGWTMTQEDKVKYPDTRVFGIYISPEDKEAHKKYLKSLWDLKDREDKPKLNLLKWTFNSHKISAIVSMTDREFEELERDAYKLEQSNEHTTFEKKQVYQAIEEIRQARKEMSS